LISTFRIVLDSARLNLFPLQSDRSAWEVHFTRVIVCKISRPSGGVHAIG
jgi:hypothetical protein